jgi:hypothetical protein
MLRDVTRVTWRDGYRPQTVSQVARKTGHPAGVTTLPGLQYLLYHWEDA